MTSILTCGYCHIDFPSGPQSCPHCARPSLFPNVIDAAATKEVESLSERYDDALQHAKQAGIASELACLEQVANQSEACFSRTIEELSRLSSSDQELYTTHYQLVGAGARIPANNKWDKFRGAVDEKVFPNYKEHIRFALLTPNGMGLNYYGDCSFVLREDMIAHRSSAFEENTMVFMEKHEIQVMAVLPTGYRSSWDDRGKLAVAKLYKRLTPGMKEKGVAALLITPKTRQTTDDFIEIHVYGSISIRTVSYVTIHKQTSEQKKRRAYQLRLKAMKERLAALNIQCKVES